MISNGVKYKENNANPTLKAKVVAGGRKAQNTVGIKNLVFSSARKKRRVSIFRQRFGGRLAHGRPRLKDRGGYLRI